MNDELSLLRSCRLEPNSVRVYELSTLSLSAAHHGSRGSCLLEVARLRTGDEKYNQAARFWARSSGLICSRGRTGIPMEFQFGTNWAGFSKYAGGIIGQRWPWRHVRVLSRSAFIGPHLGRKAVGPAHHFLAALAVAWKLALGLFILVTMLHAASRGPSHRSDWIAGIDSLSEYLLNPWYESSSRTIKWPPS